MIAYVLEVLFATLTVALLGLAAAITNALQRAQRVNPRRGPYESLHRWCWASAILFIISPALLMMSTLPLDLYRRHCNMKRMRLLRAQPWNARPHSDAASALETGPRDEWGAAAMMAAIRTGRLMKRASWTDMM